MDVEFELIPRLELSAEKYLIQENGPGWLVMLNDVTYTSLVLFYIFTIVDSTISL